jgi:hypothetical protein
MESVVTNVATGQGFSEYLSFLASCHSRVFTNNNLSLDAGIAGLIMAVITSGQILTQN